MFKLSLFIIIVFTVCLADKCESVHLTDSNLITDVSGIVKFNAEYHIFYQFFNLSRTQVIDINNIDNIFDKLSWGHAVSSNLLKWNIQPKIINPVDDLEPTFFRGKLVQNVSKLVPFSGSAVVDSKNVTGLVGENDDSVLLVFTSLSKFLNNIFDPITRTNKFIFSTVHLFYSNDGIKFKRYEKALIKKSETIRNFRDPVVFRYADDHYNLIMEENDKLGIHQSSDLINWRKVSTFEYELAENEVELETPNLVRIGDRYLLVISSNREPEFGSFHYCTTKYFVGFFDGYTFKVDGNQVREFDGPDLYAIGISEDHIMMGMLNNWKYLTSIPFNGTLSYPRRIGKLEHLNNTYLTQQFINLDAFTELLIDKRNIIDDKLTYTFIVNRPHYLKIKLKNTICSNDCDFELKFSDTNNTIKIGYKYASNNFYLDRSGSIQVNKYYNDVHRYKMKYNKLLQDEFDIDIILDVNSIEMITDRGVVAMTALHLNNKIFQTFTLTKKHFRITQFTVNHFP